MAARREQWLRRPPLGNAALAAKNKHLAGSNKTRSRGETTKTWDRNETGGWYGLGRCTCASHREERMDHMSWTQRGVVLLSIVGMTLIGLAISKAPAGEQTRFYGPDGRSTGTATTSGNTTTFYGADGRRTGSATTSGNTTTFYGADGRRTGSATAPAKR